MTNERLEEIWNEGYAAGMDSVDPAENPYEGVDEQAERAWLEGWGNGVDASIEMQWEAENS
jgi:ribosome modulation factor